MGVLAVVFGLVVDAAGVGVAENDCTVHGGGEEEMASGRAEENTEHRGRVRGELPYRLVGIDVDDPYRPEVTVSLR